MFDVCDTKASFVGSSHERRHKEMKKKRNEERQKMNEIRFCALIP